MKKSRLWVSVVAVSCLCTCGLVAQQTDPDLTTSANNPPAASQPVPRLIMFSGTVKDLTGKPLTGPVELNFAIYKEQADAAPLWEESQPLNVDEQGHYTALLGAMQPEGLPVDLFTSGEARWLGVSAGKLPEQPRTLLVSVPYALKANDAEMLAGKPASAYMLAPPAAESATSQGPGATGATGPRGAATPDTATPGKPKSGATPNVAGTGTMNYIPLWTNSTGTLGNSVIFQSGGKVGIGTATPAFGLDLLNGNGAGLQVKSSSSSQEALLRLTTGNSPGSGTSNADMQFVDGTQLSFRFLSAVGNVAGTRYNGFISYVDRDGTKLPVRFFTTDAGGTPQAGFYLSAGQTAGTGGNVGIGTTTPAATLEVNGTAKFDGAVTFASADTFTGSQTISSGDLSLPQTTGASSGVINLGGSPFLHACCSATQDNTFVGSNAGNFTTTGSYNTASGFYALHFNTTGNWNTASGYQALYSNTTGWSNAASGYRALLSNTTGSYNTANGLAALYSNTTGSYNTASGLAALYSNTTGVSNTASGMNALRYNCNGFSSGCTANYNTAVGYSAGVTGNTADANVTGANNTFIGANSGPGTSTQLNNATAIGAYAVVSASNALVLGGNGAYAVNVGIGTTTPAAKLDVAGTGNFVTSAGTALVVNNTAGGKIFSGQNNGVEKLGVDGSGNVRANAYFDLAGNPIGVGGGNGGIGGVTVAAAFVHVVHTNISGGNICYGIGGQTIIDNPSTNGYPNALLIVTANWGALSSFAVGSGVQSVTYDDLGACALNHWLVNPDLAFGDNQKLNVLVMR